MFFRILQSQDSPMKGTLRLHHRVHVAGVLPNDMNRFLLSNTQEVLFVI